MNLRMPSRILLIPLFWLALGGGVAQARARDRDSLTRNRDFTGAEFTYVQSADVWPAINALRGSKGSTARLEDTFRDRYGDNHDAFTRLRVGLLDQPLERSGLFNRFTLQANAEVSFWGMTTNPVVSELHGRLIGLGSLSAAFEGSFNDSPVHTRIGITAGLGRGKRADGISTDLLSSMPQRTENVRMFGTDLGLSLLSDGSRPFSAGISVEYQGSVFLSTLGERVTANRWKASSFAHLMHTGPHLIVGPQPLPVDLLPRTWDFIHDTVFLSDARSLIGIGADVSLIHTRHGNLGGEAGFYGGFWGGGVSWRVLNTRLRAGSWGLSLGSVYRSQPERIWQADFGLGF